MKVEDGRRRVVIEGIRPEIDGGRFAVKRSVGETLRVEADIFFDGHDLISCLFLHRREGEPDWSETAMCPLATTAGGDPSWSGRWAGTSTPFGARRISPLAIACTCFLFSTDALDVALALFIFFMGQW